MMHLEALERKEQAKSETTRRKQILKIRAEIYEIEAKKPVQRISESKS